VLCLNCRPCQLIVQKKSRTSRNSSIVFLCDAATRNPCSSPRKPIRRTGCGAARATLLVARFVHLPLGRVASGISVAGARKCTPSPNERRLTCASSAARRSTCASRPSRSATSASGSWPTPKVRSSVRFSYNWPPFQKRCSLSVRIYKVPVLEHPRYFL